MTQKIAYDLGRVNPENRGYQRLYRLDPPLEDEYTDESHEFVVVSAADVFGTPETYIFPADNTGAIKAWSELPGSLRGHFDHDRAIEEAGYQVTDGRA